jgi:hypothetical protein
MFKGRNFLTRIIVYWERKAKLQFNNLQDNIIQGPVKILYIRKTDFEIHVHINLIHGVKIWGYQIGDQKPCRRRTDNTMSQRKRTKEKQWYITHYIENTNPTKTGDELRDISSHLAPTYYSFYKHGDKSW